MSAALATDRVVLGVWVFLSHRWAGLVRPASQLRGHLKAKSSLRANILRALNRAFGKVQDFSESLRGAKDKLGLKE